MWIFINFYVIKSPVMRILYEVFFLFRLSDFFFLLCKLPEHLLLLVNPLYLGTNIRK